MATNFDEKAATWDDDPAKVERARVVAAAVRDAVPLSPATRLLEYGAGTGLVSQFLAPAVGPITLAEPSAGRRAVVTRKIAAGELPPDTRTWDLDLTTTAAPEETFDVAVTVLTLHHIVRLRPALEGLARLLVDGGHLAIVDLEAEDGSFHADDPGFDGHHGFVRTQLQSDLEAAGFREVRFVACHELVKESRTYPLFLATSTRGTPATGTA